MTYNVHQFLPGDQMVSSLKVLYDPETDIMRDVKTVYNLLRCVLFQ